MLRRIIGRWAGIFAVAGGLLIIGCIYQPTVVIGQSMSPTLKDGRVIWVDRLYYSSHPPRDGEVVVFRLDGETYVKRIYRGPGETLYYASSGNDWVAPVKPQDIRYIRALYRRLRSGSGLRKLEIPLNSIFVLGDNYTASLDSRVLGPIPLADVIGRAHVEADPDKFDQWEFGTTHHVKGGFRRQRRSSSPRTANARIPHAPVRLGLHYAAAPMGRNISVASFDSTTR
jgi:signal peptidase I